MSNWTDIRDGVWEQINADTISSKFKEERYNKIVSEFLPFITDTGEQLVEFVYKSAYNRLKNLFEAGNELHSSLKKIVNLKNSEMQLSMKVNI